MKLKVTKTFIRGYRSLPARIQEKTDKQLERLLENQYYPSLRTRKMEGHQDIWEGTISKQYKFTYQIREDFYILRKIGTHQIYNNP